jgi:hypothetical protein
VSSNFLANSPVPADSPDGLRNVVLKPALHPDVVGEICFDAMRDERFLILPNPEVAQYAQRKHADIAGWPACAGCRTRCTPKARCPVTPLPGPGTHRARLALCTPSGLCARSSPCAARPRRRVSQPRAPRGGGRR